MKNYGVNVSGHGTVSADVMAVGTGASASKDAHVEGASLDQVQRLLTELLAGISQHAEQLPASEDVVEAVQQVQGELEKPQPNKISVMGLLRGIAGGVASVSTLVSGVEVIEHLLVGLL